MSRAQLPLRAAVVGAGAVLMVIGALVALAPAPPQQAALMGADSAESAPPSLFVADGTTELQFVPVGRVGGARSLSTVLGEHDDRADAALSDPLAAPSRLTELVDGTRQTDPERFDPVDEFSDPYVKDVGGDSAQCEHGVEHGTNEHTMVEKAKCGHTTTGYGNPTSWYNDKYHIARLRGAQSDGHPNHLCGRGEVKHNGKWGAICARGWTNTDTAVFCRSMGLENHGNALEHSAYDNSALTHRDLTAQHIKQRAAWGTGTLGDPPTQPDVANYIWMTEVKCAGDESNILDCPFGGRAGEGKITESKRTKWENYATNDAAGCDAATTVDLCCSACHFCPDKSTYVQPSFDGKNLHQEYLGARKPDAKFVEILLNCKCDAGFFMVADSVFSGRCKACPAGQCSAPGSTSIDDCYCLNGFYKNENGDCAACPKHSCSSRGSKGFSSCKCFEGFYMQDGECVLCPEGKTSSEGATSEGQCNRHCGLPHSSEAGDNALALEPELYDVAKADLELKKALAPYVVLVQKEKDEEQPLANAKTDLENAGSELRLAETEQRSADFAKQSKDAAKKSKDAAKKSKDDKLQAAQAALADAQAKLAAAGDDEKDEAQKAVNRLQNQVSSAQQAADAAASAASAAATAANEAATAANAAAAKVASKESNKKGKEAAVKKIEDKIKDLNDKMDAQRKVYEAKYKARQDDLATAAPMIAVNTEAETNAHFRSAQSRCQPRLLCLQEYCPGHGWRNPYPTPCSPWPECSKKLPAGGYTNGEIKPLTPLERAKDDVAKVLKSYDAAAGYDADPALGYEADRLERGSRGPSAFYGEFNQ